MKQFSILFALVLATCSFTTPKENAPESIIEKIEQNLLKGWVIHQIDNDKTRFSEQTKALGFVSGLTLINEDVPLILSTQTGQIQRFPEVKVIISTLEKQGAMKDYVQKKAKNGTFKHCFIESRHYFLTVVWSDAEKYQDEQGQIQYQDITKNAKFCKYRHKLIKQLSWYFEMY